MMQLTDAVKRCRSVTQRATQSFPGEAMSLNLSPGSLESGAWSYANIALNLRLVFDRNG